MLSKCMLSQPTLQQASVVHCHKPFPYCRLPPLEGGCPPLLLFWYGTPRRLEPVVQDGLNEGWQKLHWEIYKEIIDRKCLLSMRHSSDKGHDDSLHEGERIDFVLTGLFLLGRICLSRSCSFESELDGKGRAP